MAPHTPYNHRAYSVVFISLILFALSLCTPVYAQEDSTEVDEIDTPAEIGSPCPEKDLPEVLRQWMKKPPKEKKESTGSLLLVPVIGSNPATGFQLGAAGQYAFRGKEPGSLYSSVNGNLTFTTKSQLMLQVKNNVYLKGNKWFLSGDWRFFIFSQSTYGLGTNAPEGAALEYQYGINGQEVNDDSLVQPMKFNHIRFHQTVSKAVSKYLFLGLGYHFDYYYSIEDQKLDTAAGLETSHYLYSKEYGFDPQKYQRSGFSLNLVLDTRDNMVNSYKGYFLNLNWRLDPEFLGSSKSGNLFTVEWRNFISFSKRNPRHVVGFWLFSQFSPAGAMPYLALPALGYDQRGRAGRGYTQGRYRGPNAIYGEAEYRFPISQCGGILGGVLFVNAYTADRPDKKVKLFDYVRPGYGAGLRMKVDKHSRTNLQVDVGFGQGGGSIYFGASETF